jgi:hypothetical protein
MLCLTFLHFYLDSYIVNKGGKMWSELNEKNQKNASKIWKFASTCSGGSFHLLRGSFLADFSVEFVLCLVCDLSLPLFGFGHELRFFVFLSSYFLSLNFISRCVLSMHSSRGRLRTKSIPVVDGWPLLSDEWLTTGVGLTLGSVRRCRLRPSSCCCRWRMGAKGLQPW